jgi:hypothetical protein
MSDFASESGRWYRRDGSPCHEVPRAKGDGVRPTTLRDARKMGLLPSVTMITSLASRPGLDLWKQRQVLMAALTTTRRDDETDEQLVARVILDSREQAKRAAERGTAIHAAIECSYRGDPFPEDFEPWVRMVRQSLPQRNYEQERSFAHALGFGGKVDLFTRDGDGEVYDFKTKDGDLSGVEVYDEQIMQLAAYRFGLRLPLASCVNVFISRDEPTVLIKRHSPEDLARGWNQFFALLAYWQHTTGHYCATREAVSA